MPARGMARMTPSTPSSFPPARIAIRVSTDGTFSRPTEHSRLDDVVLDLLIDEHGGHHDERDRHAPRGQRNGRGDHVGERGANVGDRVQEEGEGGEHSRVRHVQHGQQQEREHREDRGHDRLADEVGADHLGRAVQRCLDARAVLRGVSRSTAARTRSPSIRKYSASVSRRTPAKITEATRSRTRARRTAARPDCAAAVRPRSRWRCRSRGCPTAARAGPRPCSAGSRGTR